MTASQRAEAVILLEYFADGTSCIWGNALCKNETCAEYQSRTQGVAMSGCFQCRARKLLVELRK